MMRFAWMMAVVACGTFAHADWPQFRGGPAFGHAAKSTVPLQWNNDTRVAWRTSLPGSGWSQPIVSGDRIFVTTAVAPSGGRPSGMMGGVMSLSTWGMGSPPSEPIEWRVLCLDRATGAIRWSKTIANARPKYGKHASNTFATETPCATADTVFAFFGATGTLVALDHDGTERWRREFGAQPTTNQFGTGASPLLHADATGAARLFIQLYNEENDTLHCLDAVTGRDLWKAAGPKGTSWATPIVWDNAGTPEVVTAGQGRVTAYALDTGAERWRFGGIDTSFACSVVADADGIYFGTSSPGSKAPAYAIARGCAGDLSLAKGQTSGGAVLWSKTKCGAGMPSPVVVGEHLYFLDKIAVCCDKRAGVEKYRKRLPGGSTAVGSPLVVGDRIYLLNERGSTTVLQAGPEFKVLAENPLGSGDEIFWATPAVADDALLIRSTAALYCIK